MRGEASVWASCLARACVAPAASTASAARAPPEQTNQVDPKFLRNQRYAKHGSEKAVREARAAAANAA